MKIIILDGKKLTSKKRLHKYLKNKLAIQDYYGNNLDALWDVLSVYDLNLDIQLVNSDYMLKSLPTYGLALIKLFEDVSEVNDKITFKVIKNELRKYDNF